MASIKNEVDRNTRKSNGCKTILVICPDGKRRSIRLGKVTAIQAKKIKAYIEDLVSAKKVNEKPEPATLLWLKATLPEIKPPGLYRQVHRSP